jgi:putative tricarboxylic transport membrane protein
MTTRSRWLAPAILAMSLGPVLGACASSGGDATDANGEPDSVEVVSHNDVGGGSDVFTRQIIKFMYSDGDISKLWPVRNISTGDSIGAMSYMAGKSGVNNVISQITPTWIVTPMTVSGQTVSLDDLTPIAGISSEPIVAATRADSDLNSLTDFVNAAKADPGEMIQTGGSTTATDSLTGQVIQAATGAKWKFLSFEDGGSRITAVLRGDADIMLGSPGDFTQQVEAKKMKVISVLGDAELPLFPGVKTTSEEGMELTGLPIQFRGIYGAPDMPESAVTYYATAIKKLVDSESWKKYATDNGLVTDYRDSPEFADYVKQQTDVFATMLDDLGLRKDQ